jgi:hypothetical protein
MLQAHFPGSFFFRFRADVTETDAILGIVLDGSGVNHSTTRQEKAQKK